MNRGAGRGPSSPPLRNIRAMSIGPRADGSSLPRIRRRTMSKVIRAWSRSSRTAATSSGSGTHCLHTVSPIRRKADLPGASVLERVIVKVNRAPPRSTTNSIGPAGGRPLGRRFADPADELVVPRDLPSAHRDDPVSDREARLRPRVPRDEGVHDGGQVGIETDVSDVVGFWASVSGSGRIVSAIGFPSRSIRRKSSRGAMPRSISTSLQVDTGRSESLTTTSSTFTPAFSAGLPASRASRWGLCPGTSGPPSRS